MTATGRPSWHECDDNLWHEANQALNLKYVQAAVARWINSFGGLALGILIAVAAANSLVSARAKGPAAILGRRAVAGQENHTDSRIHASVVEGLVQFVDGLWSERVAHLGPVERDAHNP